MNILFNRPSTPEAAAIRERIFNVLPAASYQMEKLFGLFDIEFSNDTETACVDCRTTPLGQCGAADRAVRPDHRTAGETKDSAAGCDNAYLLGRKCPGSGGSTMAKSGRITERITTRSRKGNFTHVCSPSGPSAGALRFSISATYLFR
jgi:hypothetical protein